MTKPTGDRPKMTCKNPNTSLQFEIAKQAEIERSILANRPVELSCSCPLTMVIDGELYDCKAPMGGGCVIHGERRETDYILTCKPQGRTVGRVSGNHRSSES